MALLGMSGAALGEHAGKTRLLHEPLRNPSSVGGIYLLADDFHGEAAIILDQVSNVTLRNFTIRGNRARLSQPQDLPAYDQTFASRFRANGVLLRGGSGIRVEDAHFEAIAGFAVLASGTQRVSIARISVSDSGSLKPNGRNNTTGGVLIEDGSCDWTVEDSRFTSIRGNAIWTHSRYTAPRNERGIIRRNTFQEIGRDAVQVGHAVAVQVEANSGVRIGYPVEVVDMEGGGTPVGIDTAGNVEGSAYVSNEFRDINGKCIDLDGFHHGVVSGNRCLNNGAEAPYGHFGIVMNNTNPDMQSVSIVIRDNLIEGTKYGGIFVIGSGHVIEGNVLRSMQSTRCSDPEVVSGCSFFADEPELLRTGIYLGQRAERPAVTRGNRIIDNEISGWRMDHACVGFAPQVVRAENTIRGNRCRHEP